MIKRTPFALSNTEEISVFILENKFLKVKILDLGATILSILYKPLKRETVLGLESYEDILASSFYLGCTVGRTGNRIRNGKFTLNGTTYQLPLNGRHHLHGGPDGFDKRRFHAEILDDELILTLISKDGDGGYPGTLDLQIVYALDGPSLIMTTSALSDQDTLFDTTQHTYFNLNPDHSRPIHNHTLKLNSHSLYEIDPDGCTGPTVLDVRLTPFDFTSPKTIEKAMDFNHPQIQRAKGIDHYFLKAEFMDPLIATMSVDDLSLKVTTTHPGAHIYSGNYLAPLTNGTTYPFLIENGGICFETQHVPNSINFDLNEAPILKANTLVTSTTTYTYQTGEPDENTRL